MSILENQDPPPKKRLRRSSDEKSSRSSSENKSRTKPQSETVTYRSEITIYDKHCHCLLTDGEYEMCMEESGAPLEGNFGNRSTWETVCEGNGKVFLKTSQLNSCLHILEHNSLLCAAHRFE